MIDGCYFDHHYCNYRNSLLSYYFIGIIIIIIIIIIINVYLL